MASAAKNLRAVATVRIGSVERWCDAVKAKAQGSLPAGLPVIIYTQTCQPARFTGCDGREWMVELECARKLRGEAEQGFYEGMNYWVCEHQLEMD